MFRLAQRFLLLCSLLLGLCCGVYGNDKWSLPQPIPNATGVVFPGSLVYDTRYNQVAIAAWKDPSNNLFASIYNAKSEEWQTLPVQLNAGGLPLATDSKPALAMTVDFSVESPITYVMATWIDNSGSLLYAVLSYQNDTASWTVLQGFEDLPSLLTTSSPSLAIHRSGYAVISVIDSNFHVHARTTSAFSASPSTWLSAQLDTSTSGENGYTQAALATGTITPYAVVVWTEGLNPNSSNVYASILTDWSLANFDAPTLISNHPQITEASTHSLFRSIAIKRGCAAVVMSTKSEGIPSKLCYNIFNGDSWLATAEFVDASVADQNPSLAWDGNTLSIAASNTTPNAVLYQGIYNLNSSISWNRPVYPYSGDDVELAEVLVDDAGTAMAAWARPNSSTSIISTVYAAMPGHWDNETDTAVGAHTPIFLGFDSNFNGNDDRLGMITYSYEESIQFMLLSTGPKAPSHLQARQIKNALAFHTKHYILLTWEASPSEGVAGYKIYRNNVFVGSSNSLSFTDHKGNWQLPCRYSVTAYDSDDNESKPASNIVN